LSWEVILVDDGSTDGSIDELQVLQKQDPRFRILRSTGNHGQSAALWSGFQAAQGRFVATIDADLQNDPHDFPRLLAQLAAADMAVGERQNRKDGASKRWASRIANGFRRWLLQDGIPDTGCSLKLFRREVVSSFVPFRGMHRFMPALAMQAGFRVVSIPVGHRERRFGVSKYGIGNRLFWPFADCLAVWWMSRRLVRGVKYVEPHDAAPRENVAPAFEPHSQPAAACCEQGT
jgi:glycosyltransferase involved in cell wall biosynthesis